jgi:hypothetical protein
MAGPFWTELGDRFKTGGPVEGGLGLVRGSVPELTPRRRASQSADRGVRHAEVRAIGKVGTMFGNAVVSMVFGPVAVTT